MVVNVGTGSPDETVTFRANRFDRSPGARIYTLNLFNELAVGACAAADLARLCALVTGGRRIGGKAVLRVDCRRHPGGRRPGRGPRAARRPRRPAGSIGAGGGGSCAAAGYAPGVSTSVTTARPNRAAWRAMCIALRQAVGQVGVGICGSPDLCVGAGGRTGGRAVKEAHRIRDSHLGRPRNALGEPAQAKPPPYRPGPEPTQFSHARDQAELNSGRGGLNSNPTHTCGRRPVFAFPQRGGRSRGLRDGCRTRAPNGRLLRDCDHDFGARLARADVAHRLHRFVQRVRAFDGGAQLVGLHELAEHRQVVGVDARQVVRGALV